MVSLEVVNAEGVAVENWEWESAENRGEDGGCQAKRIMWVNVAGYYGMRVGTVRSDSETDAGKWWFDLVFADRRGRRLEIEPFFNEQSFDTEDDARRAAERAFEMAGKLWALLP